MTVDEKLDQILKEVRDLRTILEGLMQPLVIFTPPPTKEEPHAGEEDLPPDHRER